MKKSKLVKALQGISNKVKELVLGLSLVTLFFVYYFDILNDGMMVSGFITLIAAIYALLIWQEKIYDERDEYIRSKVDRYLYIITILVLTADIVYKTFTHTSYISNMLILCVLSIGKIILSKIIKSTH